MSILKAFAQIATNLVQSKDAIHTLSLDEIAIACDHYAYIGARKSLKTETLARSTSLPNKQGATPEEWVRQWYNKREWDTDSGVFPDFVLAYQGNGALGNGALLELKDSKKGSIASFNSTLPVARKTLDSLDALVKGSVQRWELPLIQQAGYPDERDCFYLIRTFRETPEKVRVSVVQGTFFETLSTEELLKAVWQELLRGKTTDAEREQVAEILSRIERTDISSTRRIVGASIKPRLRLMSEIEAEGNPHTYTEIPSRTFNLILKPKPEVGKIDDFKKLLEGWVKQENLTLKSLSNTEYEMTSAKTSLTLTVFPMQHKRNGIHWVCQVKLP